VLGLFTRIEYDLRGGDSRIYNPHAKLLPR